MVEFSGEADHVHLLFEATPTVEPARFVNNLKTVTSRAIRKNHPEHLSKFYRKRVLWSGSYAILTAGGAPLEVLKQYIQGQRKPHEAALGGVGLTSPTNQTTVWSGTAAPHPGMFRSAGKARRG